MTATALAGLAGLVMLAACGKPTSNEAGSGTVDPSPETTAEQGLGGSLNPDTGSSAGTKTATPRPSTTKSSAPPGPRIEYFRIAQSPICPNLAAPYPIRQDLKLSWKASDGAKSVNLYLNGGLFYSGKGIQETDLVVAFACSSTPNAVATHKYKIVVMADSGERSAELTVSARTPP